MVEIPYHYSHVRIAHAVLAASAFLVWFPLGGIIIRVWDHRDIVWIHAVMQAVGLALFVAAAGMGIWMGNTIHEVWMQPPPTRSCSEEFGNTSFDEKFASLTPTIR